MAGFRNPVQAPLIRFNIDCSVYCALAWMASVSCAYFLMFYEQNRVKHTHVKTHKLQQTCSRLVAMLFQQLVNRMCSHCLFPACWQVVNSLLTTCYKVVDLNRLVTSCSNNLLSSCNSTICQQVVSDNLVATWWNNMIVTTCWQACYKPGASTSGWQVVRFLRV
jgi:hypothetical protein